jgi:hypothetical protein
VRSLDSARSSLVCSSAGTLERRDPVTRCVASANRVPEARAEHEILARLRGGADRLALHKRHSACGRLNPMCTARRCPPAGILGWLGESGGPIHLRRDLIRFALAAVRWIPPRGLARAQSGHPPRHVARASGASRRQQYDGDGRLWECARIQGSATDDQAYPECGRRTRAGLLGLLFPGLIELLRIAILRVRGVTGGRFSGSECNRTFRSAETQTQEANSAARHAFQIMQTGGRQREPVALDLTCA